MMSLPCELEKTEITCNHYPDFLVLRTTFQEQVSHKMSGDLPGISYMGRGRSQGQALPLKFSSPDWGKGAITS